MAAANMQPIKTFVMRPDLLSTCAGARRTSCPAKRSAGGRRTRRYPCAAAGFLSQQSVASLGYLRAPSGVHATVRILRLDQRVHIWRANAPIGQFMFHFGVSFAELHAPLHDQTPN